MVRKNRRKLLLNKVRRQKRWDIRDKNAIIQLFQIMIGFGAIRASYFMNNILDPTGVYHVCFHFKLSFLNVTFSTDGCSLPTLYLNAGQFWMKLSYSRLYWMRNLTLWLWWTLTCAEWVSVSWSINKCQSNRILVNHILFRWRKKWKSSFFQLSLISSNLAHS